MDWLEYAAQSFEMVPPKYDAPGDLAQALNPRIQQTPALELIDKHLVELFRTPDSRLIISMPPQEGKSERASRAFPLWALLQNPDLRIAVASYDHHTARRWGRVIRDDIKNNPDVTGVEVRNDLSAQHEWQLKGYTGGVFAAGVNGALTGRPVDLLLIDDPVKDREQADSPTYRQRVWDWWTDVASTRLAPGAPAVLIMTRWHHDDLAGRLINAPDGDRWKILNIPAQAVEGKPDPLGREPGEFMQSARGRTREQWERIKVQAGPSTWASLYQGEPTPESSGVFPSEWARYTHQLATVTPDGRHYVPGDVDMLVQSWDLTFKETATSDFVVGQVWARANGRAYLLDQTRARMDFTATLDAVKAMTAKWPQAQTVLIEDKANGPAVINSLRREIPGIIPVEPDGGKYARAMAVQPFTASGAVFLPTAELLPNVAELIAETDTFPAGSHDDTVDAMTQALNYLFLKPHLGADGTIYTADDLLDIHMEQLGGY